MRIYSARGMFLGNGDCCIDLIGSFTSYDTPHEPAEPVYYDDEEDLEELLALLAPPAPKRLTGMLS